MSSAKKIILLSLMFGLLAMYIFQPSEFQEWCKPKGENHNPSEHAIELINEKLSVVDPSLYVVDFLITHHIGGGNKYDSFESYYYTATTNDGRIGKSVISRGCHGVEGDYSESRFEVNIDYEDFRASLDDMTPWHRDVEKTVLIKRTSPEVITSEQLASAGYVNLIHEDDSWLLFERPTLFSNIDIKFSPNSYSSELYRDEVVELQGFEIPLAGVVPIPNISNGTDVINTIEPVYVYVEEGNNTPLVNKVGDLYIKRFWGRDESIQGVYILISDDHKEISGIICEKESWSC